VREHKSTGIYAHMDTNIMAGYHAVRLLSDAVHTNKKIACTDVAKPKIYACGRRVGLSGRGMGTSKAASAPVA
jgi:hypothetical protein